MALEKLIVCVNCEPEVNQSCEGLRSGSDPSFEYDVFRLQVSVTNLSLMHVPE